MPRDCAIPDCPACALELRRAKAARMDAAGMSLKQIALATGCSTATVRADLGRRAA